MEGPQRPRAESLTDMVEMEMDVLDICDPSPGGTVRSVSSPETEAHPSTGGAGPGTVSSDLVVGFEDTRVPGDAGGTYRLRAPAPARHTSKYSLDVDAVMRLRASEHGAGPHRGANLTSQRHSEELPSNSNPREAPIRSRRGEANSEESNVLGLREEVRDLRRAMRELQAERVLFSEQLPRYEE